MFKLEPSAVSKRLIHAVESTRPQRRYYVTTPTYLAALFNRIMPPAAAEYFRQVLSAAAVRPISFGRHRNSMITCRRNRTGCHGSVVTNRF
ncbi:MAG: hypothetical protein IPL91_10415 [Hyphomicrobium sp.]|nr:hypothetical protein [Hyphomicrobium sp.]